MTKVVKREVKCIMCGNTSEQAIIYSINNSLGDESSNKELKSYKQKCPYCGYESNNIENSHQEKVIFKMKVKASSDTYRIYIITKTDDGKYYFKNNEFALNQEFQMNNLYKYSYKEQDALMIIKNIEESISNWKTFSHENNLNSLLNIDFFNKDNIVLNSFPSNFDEVINYIDEKFYVRNGRKEISFCINNGSRKDIMTLFLINNLCTISVMHSNSNTPSFMKDSIRTIKLADFNKIYDNIVLKTEYWEDKNYSNNNDIVWSIQIVDNKNRRSIDWKGCFPENWNSFLDILIDCEKEIYNK